MDKTIEINGQTWPCFDPEYLQGKIYHADRVRDTVTVRFDTGRCGQDAWAYEVLKTKAFLAMYDRPPFPKEVTSDA